MTDTLIPVGDTGIGLRGFDTGAGVDEYVRVAGIAATTDTSDEEFTHVVATVTASGDTTIHTPASGKSVRLHWIYAINDPVATSSTLINVNLGASNVYRAWAISKRQRVTGPVDGALVINLSATGTVAVTAILEEI